MRPQHCRFVAHAATKPTLLLSNPVKPKEKRGSPLQVLTGISIIAWKRAGWTTTTHTGKVWSSPPGRATALLAVLKDTQDRYVRVVCLIGEQPKIGDRIITLDVGKHCACWRSQPFRQFNPP